MANNVMNMDGSFKPFRAWCQHVLPLVYDDSLSYMELLNKVIVYINSFGEYLEDFSVINEVAYGGMWDITKQYKIWTVVADNDTGYMSIQNVPAGVPISNHDYWLKVADFAGQLVDLGERVIVLENKMTTAENNITTLQGDMSTAKSDILSLQGDMTAAESNITTLQNKMTTAESNISDLQYDVNALQSWSNKKVLWAGDSYGNGWDGSTSIPDPYTIASNLLGCQFVNISHGGCRFGIDETDAQYKYRTYIANYVASHSDMNTFTDVIIIGGANDIIFNPTSDISTEMNLTINYVKEHFPNANIHIGMVARLANTGATNCTFGNFERIMRKYREGARNNGVHYITNSDVINHDYTLLATDGIHLTNYTKMGRDLAELLLSGSFDYVLDIPCHVVLPDTDNNNIKPSTLSFLPTVRYGNILIVSITELAFTFTGGKTLTWHKAYKFAKVSGDANTRNGFSGASRSVNYNIACEVDYVEGGTTKHETMPFTLYLWDNYLWLSWESLTSGGSTNMNITNINMRGGLSMLLPQELC